MGLCMLAGIESPITHAGLLSMHLVRPTYKSRRQPMYKVDQVSCRRGQRQFRIETSSSIMQVSLSLGRALPHKLRRDEGVEVCCGEGVETTEEQAGADEGVVQESLLCANLSSEAKRIFMFGFGFVARALASYLKKDNWKVSGTCRSEVGRAKLEQCGFTPFLFNSDNGGEEMREDALGELKRASHWLTSVPPVADFDQDPVLATRLQDLQDAAESGDVIWIGYLSSTGVYGNWNGDWVDEESVPRPTEQRAVARLAAEKAWLQFGLDHNVPVHVFRLGGIYGPGRSALSTVLQKGGLSSRQQLRQRWQFTSRIHVEDISQTVLASMQNPCSGRIYNVVDDDPAPRHEVIAYAHDLLRKSSSFAFHLTKNVSFSANSSDESNLTPRLGGKRVSNKRIKQELKVQLLYPTFRSGLLAILETVDINNGSLA